MKVTRVEHGSYIKIAVIRGNNAMEYRNELVEALRNNALPYRPVARSSAADKGWLVDSLDPRPDAVALYSECTPGKRRALFLPDDRHTAYFVGLRGGWRHDRTKLCSALMDPMLLCPGKGLVLPTNLTIDEIAKNTRFFILSLQNNEMPSKSPFAIFKALQAIESHPSNSKLCPKWKTEKEIQVIKTNRNIPYVEERKLIAPQLFQSYAQVTKPSTATTTLQTDGNITKIVCPPLKLLQPLITISKPTISSSVPAVTKSSTSTQAQLLPSTSSVTVTSPSKSQPPNSLIDTGFTASGNLSISAASSSSTTCSVLETTTTTSSTIPTTSQDTNQTSKP
ncbi:uncharacterized protein TNCV_3802721 [Trichonephila clavipes]|nr:uncharacterized protein TNCV_3802721 [Trichonephila clavipes]